MSKKQRVVSKQDIMMSIKRNNPYDMELTETQIEYVVNAFLNEITERVNNGNRVVIKGFGTFNKTRFKPRYYVTPTKQEGIAEEKYKLTFSTSYKITELFNK